jgi:hypothetical protein
MIKDAKAQQSRALLDVPPPHQIEEHRSIFTPGQAQKCGLSTKNINPPMGPNSIKKLF